MLPQSDSSIEAFRQTVERLTAIPGILETLEITLARADELLCLIEKCSCCIESARLRDERAAIGHPMTLCTRQTQLESELRRGLLGIGDQLRAGIDAAKAHVTTAAGGAKAVQKYPFACRHLSMLARYRDPLPPTESIKLQLGLIAAAWCVIDAAMGALNEIRFEARAESLICQSQDTPI